MVHCKSYIVHRKSMIRVWFPWKSEMVMKITINLSFMYFALHLSGTIRHIISNFKDQDGSGFGQMPNLQYQWSWRDSCCHWRWCGSVKTASPLVISLISQENFLAWASPALGLLAGAKHLVSGKEKKKEREKKRNFQEKCEIPPRRSKRSILWWSLGTVRLDFPRFYFVLAVLLLFSPLSPWRFFLNVGLSIIHTSEMSKVPDLLAQSYPVWVLCAWTVENVQLSQIRGKKQEKKKDYSFFRP